MRDESSRIENCLNVLVLLGVCGITMYMINSFWEMANQPVTKIEVQYDCRFAEISVDYPQEVKQKCRKLLAPTVRSTQ